MFLICFIMKQMTHKGQGHLFFGMIVQWNVLVVTWNKDTQLSLSLKFRNFWLGQIYWADIFWGI